MGLAALTGGGAGLTRLLAGDRAEAAQGSSRVALVRNKKLFQAGSEPDAEQAAWMLAAGVGSLFGVEDPSEAWGKLFGPDDVVGIKVNCIAGPELSTHPNVVAAITDALKAVGVAEENIIIWDRKGGELTRAGYGGLRTHINAPVPEFDAETDASKDRATLEAVMSKDYWNDVKNHDSWSRKQNQQDNPNGDWIAAGHLFKVLYSYHRLIGRVEDKEKVKVCSRILLERYMNPNVQGG